MHPHTPHEGFLDHELKKIEPIPVEIMSDRSKNNLVTLKPPDFGGWETFVMSNVVNVEDPSTIFTPTPIQILSQQTKRRKAIVVCQVFLGAVVIGSREQINSGNAGNGNIGFLVTAGVNSLNSVTFEVESQSDVWCTTLNVALAITNSPASVAYVSIHDEMYRA